jgi:hypothetical protein
LGPLFFETEDARWVEVAGVWLTFHPVRPSVDCLVGVTSLSKSASLPSKTLVKVVSATKFTPVVTNDR